MISLATSLASSSLNPRLVMAGVPSLKPLATRGGLGSKGIAFLLAMTLALIAGSLVIGPLDRIFDTRKYVGLAGALASAAVDSAYS